MDNIKYVPVTPAGTLCMWLESETEDEVWKKLLERNCLKETA